MIPLELSSAQILEHSSVILTYSLPTTSGSIVVSFDLGSAGERSVALWKSRGSYHPEADVWIPRRGIRHGFSVTESALAWKRGCRSRRQSARRHWQDDLLRANRVLLPRSSWLAGVPHATCQDASTSCVLGLVLVFVFVRIFFRIIISQQLFRGI